jgi:hypothetical protein
MTDLETIDPTPDVTAPATVETPAVETPAAEVEAPAGEPTAVDTASAIEEREIAGQLNGQPYVLKVPKGFALPWKRGEETGFAPLEEIEKSPNFERDYQHKMQALARQRREIEQAAEAREVEYRARLEQAAENRRRMLEAASKGGEALDRERRHQELLETDPDYRKRWDESEEYRIRERLEAHRADRAEQEETHAQAEAISAYIAREATKYPGVDADRVRALYGMALQAGRFTRMHADDIDALFRDEMALVERGRGTVMTEVESLKAKLAALEAERAAQAHNETVARTIERTGRAPAGQRPARGAVPSTAPFKPYDPHTESEAEFQARYRVHKGAA